MQQFIWTTFVFIYISPFLLAQESIFPTALSDRIANYDIQVTLDAETKILDGKETLIWKNPSGDTIRELQFHLYFNGFSNNKTSFLKNSFRSGLNEEDANDCKWGWSRMTKMQDEAGHDLLEQMSYIREDDGNKFDKSVVKILLIKPVMPYETVTYQIEFTAQMPQIIARAGYSKDYHFLVHWFPKIGVYEPAGMRYSENGQWNCHQFHGNTEFYADFGVYNVDITVPANYIVGASGSLQKITEQGETRTHSYRAEDVIDFAWTACADFVVIEDQWKEVSIKLLTFPEHEYFSHRYLKAVKHSMEYLDEHVGEYPYPTLTILDPPFYGIFSGGMEYPTLITGGGLYGLTDGIRFTETLTAHEFIHQYFMQMVATNEMEESWMDEGFTSYFEGRIMDKYYGEKESSFDLLGIHAGNTETTRLNYTSMNNPSVANTKTLAYQAKRNGYRTLVYDKTAVWLKTLEGLVGLEVMDEIIQTYFQRWKFKHPAGRDFIVIVNEVVKKNYGQRFGENMDWFFEQTVYGTEICDYKLASLSNREIPAPIGFFEDLDDCITPKEVKENAREDDDKVYLSEVVVHRLGDMYMPQEVLIHFESGEEKLETWDGKARAKTFTYQGTNKVLWANVDPEHKIQLDVNFNNNSLSTDAQTTGIWKYLANFLTWLQHGMQAVSLIV